MYCVQGPCQKRRQSRLTGELDLQLSRDAKGFVESCPGCPWCNEPNACRLQCAERRHLSYFTIIQYEVTLSWPILFANLQNRRNTFSSTPLNNILTNAFSISIWLKYLIEISDWNIRLKSLIEIVQIKFYDFSEFKSMFPCHGSQKPNCYAPTVVCKRN